MSPLQTPSVVHVEENRYASVDDLVHVQTGVIVGQYLNQLLPKKEGKR